MRFGISGRWRRAPDKQLFMSPQGLPLAVAAPYWAGAILPVIVRFPCCKAYLPAHRWYGPRTQCGTVGRWHPPLPKRRRPAETAWAEAVAVGPHVRTVKVKDKVLFNPEDRFEVEMQGEEYVILRERDIHAVASERIDGGTGLYL